MYWQEETRWQVRNLVVKRRERNNAQKHSQHQQNLYRSANSQSILHIALPPNRIFIIASADSANNRIYIGQSLPSPTGPFRPAGFLGGKDNYYTGLATPVRAGQEIYVPRIFWT